MIFPIVTVIIGLIIWIPSFYIVSSFGGPWFQGTEIFGALGPVLALFLPGLLSGERGANVVLVSIAIAPVLMVIGSFMSFFSKRFVFGSTYSPTAEALGPLLPLPFCALIGWAIYRLLNSHKEPLKRANDV
jgi:hypothetical protein